MGQNIINAGINQVLSKTQLVMLIDSSGNSIDSLGSGGGGGGSAGVSSLNGLTGTLSLVAGTGISLGVGTTTITINAADTNGVNGPTGSFTNSVATWLGTGGNQLQDTLVTIDQAGNTNVSSGNLTLGTAIGNVINVEPTSQFNIIMPGDVTSSASFQVDNTLFGADHIKLTNPTGVFIPANSGTVAIGTLALPFATGQFINLNAQTLTVNGQPVLTSDSWIPTLGVNSITGTVANFTHLTGNIFNFSAATGTIANVTTQSGTNLIYTNITGNQITAGTGTATLLNSLQYETTQASGNTTATSYTVNWNSGTAQILSFFGAGTGCAVTLTGGLAGSTYTLETINNTTGTTAATWAGSNTKWLGGNVGAMTQSGTAIDIFVFQYDGLRYLANPANNYF